MDGVLLQQMLVERVMDRIRGWVVVLLQVPTARAASAVDRAAIGTNRQQSQPALLDHQDVQPPQHWSPVRPALYPGAGPHLGSPYGAAPRLSLGTAAASHLVDAAGW
jgi:hypothetical protein